MNVACVFSQFVKFAETLNLMLIQFVILFLSFYINLSGCHSLRAEKYRSHRTRHCAVFIFYSFYLSCLVWVFMDLSLSNTLNWIESISVTLHNSQLPLQIGARLPSVRTQSNTSGLYLLWRHGWRLARKWRMSRSKSSVWHQSIAAGPWRRLWPVGLCCWSYLHTDRKQSHEQLTATKDENTEHRTQQAGAMTEAQRHRLCRKGLHLRVTPMALPAVLLHQMHEPANVSQCSENWTVGRFTLVPGKTSAFMNIHPSDNSTGIKLLIDALDSKM